MKNGFIKNGSLILVVWTIYLVAPDDFILPVSIVVSGFIASTLVSIFENMDGMGIKIPKKIEDKLDKGEDNDEPEKANDNNK